MKETGNKMMFNADVEAFLTLPSAIKLVSLLMLTSDILVRPPGYIWPTNKPLIFLNTRRHLQE